MATEKAAEIARQRGNLPGSLEMLLGSFRQHKVNWKAVLADFVQTHSNRNDYSYRRPNNRYVPMGLYMPMLESESMPEIVIYNDTSGSCFDKKVQTAFVSEINGVMDTCKPEKVTVISGDVRVTAVDEFEQGEEIFFQPKGGGGTDFRPIFQEVTDRGIEPVCMVCFTDSYGDFPLEAPDYPVLWCVYCDPVPIPFGEIVRVELDD